MTKKRMSEIESKLKEENEIIKEFFDFNGDQKQLSHIKDYIKNSKNGPIYFIRLFDYYSKIRSHQTDVSKELVEYAYSCFPEQIHEIQQEIKTNTLFLKFIMFPEEFPINESKEQKEMFLLLQNDDIDGFISFLSKNSTIDITKEQTVDVSGYYYYLFDWSDSISLIDFCCFFGSLKCFKYLLLNKCEITKETPQYSISGGNKEIINILKEKEYSFANLLKTSILFHRYELTKWILENYECEPIPLSTIIKYYNIESFMYFLEHGHPLEEIDVCGHTSLHLASTIGDLTIVQYLIEKGANIEADDNYRKIPLHGACENGHLPVVQYLIEKGADIEAKDNKQKTPINLASENHHSDVIKYFASKGPNKNAKNQDSVTSYDVAEN